MHASATQSLSAVLVAAMLPAVTAHMSMFHPSMYGFNSGDPETVYPLANKGFDQWWFRGQLRNPPRETMMLTPGTTQTVEITCGKWISSYGGGSNPNREACPNDQGSYHAGGQGWGGWGGNQESNLMGCALAIAYKADPWAVKPEDFIVMSVQENCVRQRDTPFEIPSNLPACPEGGCTCAWFWQGQNSAEEMYMTGFKCDVKGGAKTAIPQPHKPRQNGNSDAATQPYYWANHGAQNVDWQVGWTTRPKYNSKMGWKNGAQTRAFADAAPVQPPATSTTSTASTTTSRAQVNPPRPTQPVVDHLAADPQSSAAPSATTSPASTAAPSKQCKRKIHRRRRSRDVGAAQNH